MKVFALLLLALLCSSCFYYHFEFDEVQHYALTENQGNQLMEQEWNDSVYKRLRIVSTNDLPEISDPAFTDSLIKTYGTGIKVDKQLHHKLYDIYCEGIHTNIYLSRCVPVYRDVLVFKKSGKITGVSKICFDCKMHYTVDGWGNVKEINESSAFDELKDILRTSSIN